MDQQQREKFLELYQRYRNKFQVNKKLSFFILLLLTLVIGFAYSVSAPNNFPVQSTVKITKGSSIAEIADQLADKNIVRNKTIFRLTSLLVSRKNGLLPGRYYFDQKLGVFEVVRRLARGEFDPSPFKIVIPEGSNNLQIAKILKTKLQGFDDIKFINLAEDYEGKLFPDTYFFIHKITEEELIEQMNDNFSSKLFSIRQEIEKSGRKPEDVITMASIIEEEAANKEARRIVSGILWKRIDKGMKLQVDAVFPYIIGVGTFDLTKKDLRVDSLYNTYKYKGLPPGPITNPGLDSILAAIQPATTSYLFYLSDRKGNMYYAVNYKEHLRNIKLYLN
ncbi:MAG: endolytic transglycosylase MltG [bacterium]